jgi:hypothetical protein
LRCADKARLGLEGVAQVDQHVVHVAVERIGIDDGLVAGDGGGPICVGCVKGGDIGFAGGQRLLHLAQTLFGLRHQRRIGELLQHQAILGFGVTILE